MLRKPRTRQRRGRKYPRIGLIRHGDTFGSAKPCLNVTSAEKQAKVQELLAKDAAYNSVPASYGGYSGLRQTSKYRPHQGKREKTRRIIHLTLP